jgi:hypothetical protein
LPAAAHEAQAFPVLLRALAATARLIEAPATSLGLLPDVVWDDPSITWQPGRLIRLPSLDDTAPATMVLSGALDDRVGDGDPMRLGASAALGFPAQPNGIYEGGLGGRAGLGRLGV